MDLALKIARITATLTVAVFFGVATWIMWRSRAPIETAAYNTSLAAYNTNQTIGVASATLAALNAPCRDFQGDYICGPIPQLAQMEKNIGIMAGQGAQQLKNSTTLVNASAAAVSAATIHFDDSLDAVQGTAKAATGTLNQTTTDLATLNTSLVNVPPLLVHADGTIVDFDNFLKSKAVTETAAGLAATTTNLGLMTHSFYTWEDPILHPPPCTTGKCRAGRIFSNWVEPILGVGSNGVKVANAFTPEKVTLVK